ncbi:TPA: hypothetical protein NKO75_005023 [Vibrio parahaemolyticus]|uniref:hypothetical protein n=1 Tax=Vibrio parahaemolyticus TaxID=670 RepID=UPI00111E66B9|nr:hypothetical protein [Vibrio parahaemolyticus]TOG77321.1 hypothetical protein CGI94_17510 [Vibrio parahaemolyticus]HCH0798290.1 hypothetical protein [Vibrio parahaemolyticus]HCH0799525.1 hypothetical protein [Vibrio parahaemolyticus]
MTSRNEINEIFKKYHGKINKRDIQKVQEYCKYKHFSGSSDKTVDYYRRAILRVRSLVNKPFRYWTQADALNAYYRIYEIPLCLMHKKKFKGMLLCDVLENIKNTEYQRIDDGTARKIIETIKPFLNWLVNGNYIKKMCLMASMQREILRNQMVKEKLLTKKKLKEFLVMIFFTMQLTLEMEDIG